MPRMVAVACSSGGLKALVALLSALPASFPAPIVVAQHRGGQSPDMLPELLRARTGLAVAPARHLGRLTAGTVHVCPPARHIEVANGRLMRVLDAPRIRWVRPSGDLLFRSVADVFGARAVCVVLSGGGHDGAMGTRAVRAAGGYVIAQDAASSAVPDMPNAAVDIGRVDLVLPVEKIAYALTRLVSIAHDGPPARRYLNN